MTATRSARSAVDRRWAITITVRLSMRATMAASTSASVPGSRFDVASSSTSTAGSAGRHSRRHQLPFTGRRARAPLAHFGLETFGEAGEVLVDSDEPHRLVDLGVGGTLAGQANGVADGALEEVALLGDDGDALAQ